MNQCQAQVVSAESSWGLSHHASFRCRHPSLLLLHPSDQNRARYSPASQLLLGPDTGEDLWVQIRVWVEAGGGRVGICLDFFGKRGGTVINYLSLNIHLLHTSTGMDGLLFNRC